MNLETKFRNVEKLKNLGEKVKRRQTQLSLGLGFASSNSMRKLSFHDANIR